MEDGVNASPFTDTDEDEASPNEKPPKCNDLLYSIEDAPPWYLCITLGFQQYLTMFGSAVAVPLLLSQFFCVSDDNVGISQIISTVFFVSGLSTLLQTTLGSRLPIVQGASFSFVAPTIAVMSLPEWCCPFTDQNICGMNDTDIPEAGSEEHRIMWKSRIAEIQGAIIVSSLFQVVIGFSGVMGFMLKFIGPLVIVPTTSLIGLGLFGTASKFVSESWGIGFLTIFLISLFSQYLRSVNIPVPVFRRGKGCTFKFVGVFALFPVLLGMCLSWLVCYILTVSEVLSSDPGSQGYQARTDTRIEVLNNAPWFRFPYPGQWGTPTVSVAGVFAMLAGVLASMVESVGDYYACARLSGAPPPPDHAVNRGIGVEGIGCLMAGLWGSGNGTTSYSQNIGAIGITKVASRRVIQIAGVTMILWACFGKFGALFVTVPNPVIGGMFMVTFGMVSAVGLSNLQFVDLNSSRNLFILGLSIFLGLSLPTWMSSHPTAIQTGSSIADQILTVMCRTHMLVGGFVGFVLDNTMPGTAEERGIIKWRQNFQISSKQNGDTPTVDLSTYDFPLVQNYINRWSWARFIPFCPKFKGFAKFCRWRDKPNLDERTNMEHGSSLI